RSGSRRENLTSLKQLSPQPSVKPSVIERKSHPFKPFPRPPGSNLAGGGLAAAKSGQSRGEAFEPVPQSLDWNCRANASPLRGLPDCYDHLAVARAVQLDQHDRLPGAECEPTTLDRNSLTRSENRCLKMSGTVIVNLVVAPNSFRDKLV